MCKHCQVEKGWEVLAKNQTQASEVYDVCIIDNKIIVTDCYDEAFEVEINYCPMCGRGLNEKESEEI